ncbi:MAG: hypothetical protein IJV06_10070 [Bacteroidaceae bacterium]|nr:hypothetical protein [Bacteroidaceae bacterium]
MIYKNQTMILKNQSVILRIKAYVAAFGVKRSVKKHAMLPISHGNVVPLQHFSRTDGERFLRVAECMGSTAT